MVIGRVYAPSKIRVALAAVAPARFVQTPPSSTVNNSGLCVFTLATTMCKHTSAQSSRQIAKRGSYRSAPGRNSRNTVDEFRVSVGTASVIGACSEGTSARACAIQLWMAVSCDHQSSVGQQSTAGRQPGGPPPSASI